MLVSIDSRPATEASSSSSSDFYSADPALNEQVVTPSPPDGGLAFPALSEHSNESPNEDESSSEMDLSSPSRRSTPLPVPAVKGRTGSKRKLCDAVGSVTASLGTEGDSAKKRKTLVNLPEVQRKTMDIARLPPELWQRVFLHLPPPMLARCLRICKMFNTCLTASSDSPSTGRLPKPRVSIIDSETIWKHSRKTYMPLLPRPLARCSELRMLHLLTGRTCQFCNRSPVLAPATSIFNAGPGPSGLRIIWPFGVRTCGVCLKSRTIKDVEVLSNHLFKDLRFGVSYGFCSQDLHFASDSVRTQVQGGIPANLRFSKIMYRPDLEAIKAKEEHVKLLGDGVVDEWRKGLVAHGKEVMADSARWEKWELQLRPGADFIQVLREYDLSSFPRYFEEARCKFNGVNAPQPLVTANGTHPLPQPVHVFSKGYSTGFQPVHPQFPHVPFPPQQPLQLPYSRPPRNPQEVEAARQTRKNDIERRCQELIPPLEPNVLQHIESFQAALQITTPMTDAMWDMLKPRILAQREAAELVEHERASQLAALQATLPSTASDEMLTRPAKETYDREYEQAQDPLRKRLGEYADDYINGQWGGGKMLEKDNAPIFAIHVLLHVRHRYHEDANLDFLPKFDPPQRKDISTQGTPPLEPFLSLDNMKWVYDNKVRPLTDVHRREHFICAGCAEEKKPKWFAFEGLIQHYGAKHTTAFSKGNIIVHWQTAEWPADPPFHANPGRWLKVDRKTDHKSHGRARHTPQNNHEGPFPAPAPISHLPDNPYHFSAKEHSTVSQGNPPPHFVSPSVHNGSNGYFHPQAGQPQPQVDMMYDTKLKKLASDSREIWDSLDGIQDLETCVRIGAALHHAHTRFQDSFHRKPPLDLLTDALATDSSMRPLKNAYGLACKSCIAASPNAGSGSYWVRVRGAKLYNTSSLITHFKLMHLPHDQLGYVDLMEDMVEMPESQQLRDLLRTVGMDDDKLALLAAAFPFAFPNPLPKIGLVKEGILDSAADGLPSRLLDRLSKKQKNQPKRKGQKGINTVIDREDSQEPLPEPTEDEYDPRRPMFVAKRHEALDPSQFDTDARRPPSPSGLPTSDFSAHTFAALHAALNGSVAPPKNGRSRSPSVGSPGPPSALHNPGNTTIAMATEAPDIAAILASLTGQPAKAHTATPSPVAFNRGSGSPNKQRYQDSHAKHHREIAINHQIEDSRYSGRLDPFHQPIDSAALNGLQELQAALSNNTLRVEQNQRRDHADVPYAPGHHAPARYQYMYDREPHYSHPSALQPIHRDATSVQYIQVPQEREPAAPEYQYSRAAPRPIYVDQYGRTLEFITIDSAPAPAPAQYSPVTYGQPAYSRRQEPPIYAPVGSAGHYQPVYDDRRPFYYEQIPSGSGSVVQRYMYDSGSLG